MAEVLFTHSYFLQFDPKEHKAMMPYPPLGTIYAAAVARSRGFSVALHDVMLEKSERSLVRSLELHRPQVLVIYDDSFNYLTKMCLSRMREAAYRLTELGKQYGSSVVVFSSDATDHLQQYLAKGADYVICGEAEITLCELLEVLLRGSPKQKEEIHGLAFLKDGTVLTTRKREILRDLDQLPFPAWDLVDIDLYRNAWISHHGYFSLNVSTTRGCPFHCNWCAKPLYGQVYNSKSPERVVAEIKYLKEFANPGHLWITDDIFALRPGWIQKFSEVINRENVKIPFKCLSRVDLLLQEESIRHLKEAGCETVWVGAESGSQKILDAMEKGTTVEEIYESARVLHSAGIRVGFFLQFGYPGEMREDIEKTLQMVRNCKPEEIGISVSYPLPGTSFFESVKTQLGEKQNWVDSQDLDLMFAGQYHPDFYRTLHKVVHKKFRVWRGVRVAHQILQRRGMIRERQLRSLASMVYHGITLPLVMRKLGRLERRPTKDPIAYDDSQ